MCRFSSGNGFFCTKFVLWLVSCFYMVTACTCKHSCAPPKKSVTNWIIMIAPGGLLLVVPTYMQFQSQFCRWGCHKKTAKLRHLILLYRVTYWAPVEMLSQSINWCKASWKTKCLHAWAFHFLKYIVMAFSTPRYPIGTHWILISFHGKIIVKNKLCWSLHSITPLECGSFESKDPSVPS